MPHYPVVIDSSGETFDVDTRYRVVRRVGSGAYGTVVSAYDLHADRFCAIKKVYRVFDKRLVTKRCLRELKLLQHFNGHPRIIELFDMDIVNPASFNEIYLVFNCMDASLHDVIHSDKPLDLVHAQWFLYQMLSGLKYIHAANVVHRDLKPANILVNRNCDIKICDFGMARGCHTFETRSSLLTEYVTTRWYRAPEVMISPNNYSELIDVWSVGCILAEILGRRVLFMGRDYIDQLHKILGILGLPRDISFWAPSESISAHLQQLCTVDGQPPPEEPVDLAILFPNCPPEGIHMLTNLLQLDPHRRISVVDALQHPFVAAFSDPVEEAMQPRPCDFSFEDAEDLRAQLIEQVTTFKRQQNQRTKPHHSIYAMSSAATAQEATRYHDYHYRHRPGNIMPAATMSLLDQPRQRFPLDQLQQEEEEEEEEDVIDPFLKSRPNPMDGSGTQYEGEEIETSQTGGRVAEGAIMASGLVGEPDEMTEEETNRFIQQTAAVPVDHDRRFRQPEHGPARDELERTLSGAW